MRFKFFTFGKLFCVLGTLAVFSACSGPSQSALNELTGVSETTTAATPAPLLNPSLNIISGNFQIAAPSAAYTNPLIVQLLSGGNPVSGIMINFTFTTATTGTLSAVSAVTNASGMAQITLTAGATSGTVGIQASYNAVNANFTEVIADQTGNSIAISSGNSQSASVNTNVTNQLKVLVSNIGNGLPASNIVVTFLVTSGNGQINGTTNTLNITTDINGIAAINFKVGTLAGTNTIKAMIAGDTGQFTNFTETGTTSPANFDLAQSTITSSVSSLTSNGSDTALITFTLKDAYNNTLSGPVGTVVFTYSLGTPSGPVTNVGDGTYTQTLLAPTTGGGTNLIVSATYNAAAVTATASIGLVTGTYSIATSTFTVDNSSSANVNADNSSFATLRVQLKDQFGNVLTTQGGETIVFTKTGLGTLSGSVTALPNGEYIQYIQAGTITGSASITATVNGTPVGGAVNVAFVAGPASAATSTLTSNISVIPPNNTTTSTILLITKDVYSNPRSATSTGGTPTVTFTSNLGTFSGVIDKGDGTFETTIKSGAPGTAVVYAVINGVQTTFSKTIYFNNQTSAPSTTLSTVTVPSITGPKPANGSDTYSVVVTIKDTSGIAFTTGGNAVTIFTSAGAMVGSLSDNGDGTYTQLLRAPAVSTPNVVISASVDGNAIAHTATLNFYGPISLATSSITATSPSIEATGATTTVLVLQAKDSNSINIPVGGEATLAFTTTAGTKLGSILDNNNGTYTQSLQSTAFGAVASVGATQSGNPFSSTTAVTFFVAQNWAGLTMDCTADPGGPDFSTGATSIDKRIRLWGNNIVVDGGTLTMNTRSSAGYCPNSFNFGTVIVRNTGSITHSAIGLGTTVFRTEFTTATLSVDATSNIDVKGKGLLSNTANNCRVPAGTVANPSTQNTAFSTTGANCQLGGGSHGGEGGGYPTGYFGPNTYDDLFQPSDPGSSGGGSATLVNGGGIIKITVTGTASIDGFIRADGADIPTSTVGGGGGSVLLNVGTLTGGGYISAAGSSAASAGVAFAVTGGGGRIAIYYNSTASAFSFPTNIINNVRASGGGNNGSVGSIYYGAAGTIYLKGATQTYGDLLINNNGNYMSGVKTTIPYPVLQTPSAVTATTLTKNTVFKDPYRTDSNFANWYINANTAQNATPTRMDDTLFKISSSDADSVTIASGSMTTAPVNATTGTNFEMMLIFDHVEVRGRAYLNAPYILALNGDISSGNTHSATITGFIDSLRGFEFDNASISWDGNNITTSGSPCNLDLIPFQNSNRDLVLQNGFFTMTNPITANNFSLSNSTLTMNTLKNTTGMNLSGTLSLSAASTLTHKLTTAGGGGAEEYAIQIAAAGLVINDVASTITAAAKGYSSPATGYCTTLGNVQVNYVQNRAGGSHGGYGGSGVQYIPQIPHTVVSLIRTSRELLA